MRKWFRDSSIAVEERNLSLIDDYFKITENGWRKLVGSLEHNDQHFLVEDLNMAEKKVVKMNKINETPYEACFGAAVALTFTFAVHL